MIPYVAGAAVGFARSEGREVSEAFSNGMTAAVNGIGAAYGFVADKATDFVHGVGVAAGTARQFVDDRVRAVGSVVGGVRDAVGGRVDAARSAVRAGIDTVRAVPGMAVAGLAGLGRSAISGIQGWWQETTAEFSRGYEAGYGGRESAAAEPVAIEPVAVEVVSEEPVASEEPVGANASVLHDPFGGQLRPSFVPRLPDGPVKDLSGGLVTMGKDIGTMGKDHGKGLAGIGEEPSPIADVPSLYDDRDMLYM